MVRRKLTAAANHFGGVLAAARWQRTHPATGEALLVPGSPKASYASATLVSWPAGSAPLSCRFASNSSAQHSNRQPNKMPPQPLTQMNFGAAPTVLPRWRSSRGSRLPTCSPLISNSVLLRSPQQHETTPSNSNPPRASARSAPLRLAAGQIYSLGSLSAIPATLLPGIRLPGSSAVPYRRFSASPYTALSQHSIPIGPRPPQPRAASF
jgi:hypothetical protein